VDDDERPRRARIAVERAVLQYRSVPLPCGALTVNSLTPTAFTAWCWLSPSREAANAVDPATRRPRRERFEQA
jgi:hypothetical protein